MRIFLMDTEPRFELGQLVMTANAHRQLAAEVVQAALMRHLSGDWGNVCAADAAMNEDALKHGDRVLSVYGEGDKRFWIITESDRSVTTVLMPEDY